jgi:hypothetical protein
MQNELNFPSGVGGVGRLVNLEMAFTLDLRLPFNDDCTITLKSADQLPSVYKSVKQL